MKRQKINFKNHEGKKLVGYLDFPIDEKPHNFVIFVHCFTCNKNLKAVGNISRALTSKGFGVFRFDFTGLGESEGDFADTDFSGNINDLIAASDFTENNYGTPTMLVGHSFGGSAVLLAAGKLDNIRAVVSIAAPSDPEHVKKQFVSSLDEIEKSGKAEVLLVGRPFTIKKEFVDDLLNHQLEEEVKKLRKPLLIFHSPQDLTVEIKNAENIYVAARHPKSFVSLDGADHMLSNAKDSRYVGKVIAEWASRYLDIPSKTDLKSLSKVAASLDGADRFTTNMKLGNHSFMADEPEASGGNDFGPSPYEYLSGALAACKAMTLQMYARRKKWDLENVTVNIDHSRQYAADCENCDKVGAKIDTFTCNIQLTGNLTSEQKERLLEIADRCPVHKTLSSKIQIISSINAKEN